MTKELLILLRLGLENSFPEDENLSDFIVLSADKWTQLEDVAQKQGVLGIALDGIERLEATRYGFTKQLPIEQKLDWIGQVMMIEQANQHQKKVMNELAAKWNQEGCRVMVMKGQANGILYPKPEHRSTGDIDCYLFEDYARGNTIARNYGANVDEGWYKHSQIVFKEELFENHQYFVHTRQGKKSKRLQEELEQALDVDKWNCFPGSKVLLPPVQWNAMFLTYHACAHFVSEGLLLKQLLDWAMFIKAAEYKIDWTAFYDFCERYNYRRFVDAVTTISVNSLGVKLTNPDIVINSAYSDRILQSVFDESYIISRNGGWGERIQIVKNLFYNKWKYEEICQQSIWKQLWWYASGYLLRTEN